MNNEVKIIYVNIKDIVEYDKNPRKNDKAIKPVADSIREFGFKVPIVLDKNNIIIAGHTRLKAAKRLKLKEVPCIIADDLNDDQAKAFRLVDNKTNEFAEWDIDLLNIELSEIELDLTPFEFKIEKTVNDIEEDDYEVVVPDEPKSKKGDIYILGNHRLMCGDSTKEEDVDKLMDGEKADMVFTDPPYNIAYSGIKDKRTIENDKMSDEDFVEFLEKSIMVCDTAYVCCSWQYEHLFKKAMTNIGMQPKAMIIWNKVNPAQYLDKYFKQHEIIFYYGKFGGEKTLRGDIWECKRKRNTVHPTMKPLELIGMALEDNPDKKKVYDAFGGSGSTLIASEQLDRICYMMELDEKYVDVIVNRYLAHKGTKENCYLLRDGEKISLFDIEELG